MYSSSTGLEHSLEVRISLPLVGAISEIFCIIILVFELYVNEI